MDYPHVNKSNYNMSNTWWFLPPNISTGGYSSLGEQDTKGFSETIKNSPVVSYISDVSNKDKFNYLVIILVVIVFIYRLNLSYSIWMGLILGVFIIYYLNERKELELNKESSQLWAVLKSPLLKNTRYFVTDPELIKWADEVSDLKGYNVLEFDKMIISLDRCLKLIYNIKQGVKLCKENLDLIRDYKVKTLNQFHSLIYNIHDADLRDKYNQYFESLGHMLNDRHYHIIKICQQYYQMKPIDIESHMDVSDIIDPVPIDMSNNGHYDFYN